MSNPVATPSSVTAGGGNAKIVAPRIVEKKRIALAATAVTLRSGRLRRSQSLSLTNTSPWLCPRPAKPNPEMEPIDSTASLCSLR